MYNIKIDCAKFNLDNVKHLKILCYQSCPDLLLLYSKNSQRYPFLLQSTSKNNNNSRYDILFAFPQETLNLDNNNNLFYNKKKCTNNNFLQKLDLLWNENTASKTNVNELPFTGGWFLYLSYELLNQIEPSVKIHAIDKDKNIASATRIPAAIICDHKTQHTYLVVEEKYQNIFPDLQKDFETISSIDILATNTKNTIINNIHEESSQNYIDIIHKAQQYIYRGDIFQANLSRQWSINHSNDFSDIFVYKKLRLKNPASFSSIIKFNSMTIISSSPERLIKVKNNIIETRPIAGTSKRHNTRSKDLELSNNLINNEKEQAEHIMLVDMERNDLGKVCQNGSIEVNELMQLESQTHVHHLISNIKGKLKNNISPGKIINALFPGGSITGCPKIRCMEIINELEKKPRHSYTGSIGYLDNNGNMDLNILIRTIEKTQSTITFRTGAGIVYDSIPEQELQETQYKAKGLLVVFNQ